MQIIIYMEETTNSCSFQFLLQMLEFFLLSAFGKKFFFCTAGKTSKLGYAVVIILSVFVKAANDI